MQPQKKKESVPSRKLYGGAKGATLENHTLLQHRNKHLAIFVCFGLLTLALLISGGIYFPKAEPEMASPTSLSETSKSVP